MKGTRVAALLLTLALCLTLLPAAAMAEEEQTNSFTITFDASGGKFEDGSTTMTAQVEQSDGVARITQTIPAPAREGWVFAGWDVNFEWNNGLALPDDFTAGTPVKATWTAKENSRMLIPFDANGGKFSDGSTKKEVPLKPDYTGLEGPLPVPARDGYTFMGWYRGYESPADPGRKIDENEAFTAPDTVTALWGRDGAAPREPARVDFIPNGGTITSIRGIPAKDVIAGTPKAAENNIFVDNNSGIGMMMTDEYGCLDSFPEIEREGCAFEGWYIVDESVLPNAYAGKEVSVPGGARKADLSTVFQGRALLAAKWSEAAAPAEPDGPFTVTFHLNGGTGTAPKPQTVKKGGTVDLPDSKGLTPPSGCVFAAWGYLAKDGNLYVWPEERPVTSELTLFAGWVLKGNAVVDGEAIDPKPAAPAKPAETVKPAEPAKPAGAAAPAFTDVAAASPFAPAISWAVEKKITNGTTPTTFSPGNTCTRGHILTFLWRSQGSPEPAIANPFQDEIPAAFQKAAVWAWEKGLVSGDTFGSAAPCTRGSSVTYMWKLAGSPEAKAASFRDVAASSDYAKAVSWAVEQGVTKGTGDGTAFSPENTCTRGQIVTFLYRAYVK